VGGSTTIVCDAWQVRRQFTCLGVVNASYDGSGVLSGEKCGQIGRVTRIDEDGRAGPEVLQPLGRPRLGRLGLDGVLKQDGVDHVEAGAERVVGLALAAPRIQAERTVPLEQAQRDGDHRGADDDANPDPAVERLHEGVDRRTALLFRDDDREAAVEVGRREVDDATARPRDAERRHRYLRRPVEEVSDQPCPVLPAVGVEHDVPELLVGGHVQLNVELEIASQPLQQHDRQSFTTADRNKPSGNPYSDYLPITFYLRQIGCLHRLLSVCLLTGLLKKYSVDFHKIRWKSGSND